MSWEGEMFVNTVLPFGVRFALKIFTALTDALEWVMCRSDVEAILHYLDDFLLVGALGSDQCRVDLRHLLKVVALLNIPIKGGGLCYPPFMPGYQIGPSGDVPASAPGESC